MQADSPPIRGGNQDLLYRLLGKIRLWACTYKQEPRHNCCSYFSTVYALRRRNVETNTRPTIAVLSYFSSVYMHCNIHNHCMKVHWFRNCGNFTYQKVQPQNENKYFRIPYVRLRELSVFFSCSELVTRVFRQKKSKLWRVGGWKCQSKHSWLRKDYSLDLAWMFKPHHCLNIGNGCWIDWESGPVKFTTGISADRVMKERARYTFTLRYKWLGKNGCHFWTYRYNLSASWKT